MSQQYAILLLGSNLGDRKKNIENAVNQLENSVGIILKKTKIIETEAVEFCSSNIFYNFAVLLSTHFSPVQLLAAAKEIEKKIGRTEDSHTLGYIADRLIDIDIVKYSGIFFWSKKLIIPHQKHLYERPFSMELINNLEKEITNKT